MFDTCAAAREEFALLKSARSLPELASLSMSLPDGWSLIPVAEAHRGHKQTIDAMKRWREKNQHAYPSRFPVTARGTQDWLASSLLDNPQRMLWLVCDPTGRAIGHLGLVCTDTAELELDNVLRGEDAPAGTMTAAMNAIMKWARQRVAADHIRGRVLASNHHAMHFYRQWPLVELRTEALIWSGTPERRELIAAVRGEPADDAFVHIELDVVDGQATPEEILTSGPVVGEAEVALATEAARSGWWTHHSDRLSEFERAFADAVGTRYAIATSSGTGALHLALLAVGIGRGDEVIVPDLTWVATAAAVAYTGAKPVFADVDPGSWTLCPTQVASLVTPRTRAIIPVHLYGYPTPMAPLLEIAARHKLHIIEDAAPAMAARIGDRAAGSIGDAGCFSFQGAKMLVTGEGGMIVTDDEDLYESARTVNDHGRRPGTFWIDRLGHKYKMNNITAAFGLGQLRHHQAQIELKRQLHEQYRDLLPGFTFQTPAPGTTSNHWMTSILLPDEDSRHTLSQKLAEAHIDVRPTFPAISDYPIWDDAGAGTEAHNPVAHAIASRGLNLPSGTWMTRTAVERVARVIRASVDPS